MLAVPLDAVALTKLSVPWLGAEDCVQVRVCDESGSLTVSRVLMLVADAFCATLRVVVPLVKVGAVLEPTVTLSVVPKVAVGGLPVRYVQFAGLVPSPTIRDSQVALLAPDTSVPVKVSR